MKHHLGAWGLRTEGRHFDRLRRSRQGLAFARRAVNDLCPPGNQGRPSTSKDGHPQERQQIGSHDRHEYEREAFPGGG